MGKVIAVVTQKGGVAKTTTTNALAAGYVKKGFRVLCVDMDPQRNLSFSMAADLENSATAYHILRCEVRTQFAIQHTIISDLIASSPLLSSIDLEFTGKNRQFLLKQALEPIVDQYDYILIDSPPNLGILTVNALIAADYVIIPTLSDIYSLHGLVQVHETISFIKQNDNPHLTVAGVLFTRFNPYTRLTRSLLGAAEMVCGNLEIPLFETKIRNSISLTEAQNLQFNIMEKAKHSNGAKDYMALVDELLARGV